ncbi:MAG TPA: hypothetical protein VFG76_13795, partial [Candidatus Polarisedimenticolia bacterium]|nr:hypothetical protein [Candidatus Polarisedimenticolia bacterium]
DRLFLEAFRLVPRGKNGGSYGDPYVEFLIHQGRFDEAVTAARGLAAHPSYSDRAIGAALEGEALLALGRTAEAKQALKTAKRTKPAKGEDAEGWTPPQIEMLERMLALSGKRPEQAKTDLIKMADKLAENPLFDAWGQGLFRLQRLAAQAERSGHPELSTALAERMRKIDPDFPTKIAAAP